MLGTLQKLFSHCTTRDVLEETLNVKGIPVVVVDTAGIRHTDDVVEAMGVERSRKAMDQADLVLFLVDRSRPLSDEDLAIVEAVDGRPAVLVLNKSDLNAEVTAEDLPFLNDVPRVVVSAETGAGTDANFTYRRWYQETGPTANVPYAALTHMFWWDNRNAEAEIVDLRRNGIESEEECQFLEGPSGTQFSVGYRAYHPEAKFFHRHSLWWRRGLGGPTGYLEQNNPNNVGSATTVGESNAATFGTMLGDEPKCSFSLHLNVSIKTFDGIHGLGGRHDTAAFALENTSA